jgi:solute carrier family 30 (zinc transporter), member 9
MAGGSKLAVYTAITANTVVAVAKLAGFAVTGSGSMLSEGIHSIADVGNQGLLAVGLRAADLPADDDHPDGYGNDAFVWSIISAVGMFFLGCGVSITHGVQALLDPHGGHDGGDSSLNLWILAFALVIEGGSLAVAVWGLKKEATRQGQGLWSYLQTTDDPFGVAVLLEDGAAVLGVCMALVAIGLAASTGHAYWDAIGSIAIGVLLGLVAFFLIRKNRTLLIGRAIRPVDRERVKAILEADPAVEQVVMQQAVVTGTSSYRITAEIDFDGRYLARRYLEERDVEALVTELGDADALQSFLAEFGEAIIGQMGDEIDRIEDKIREELPKASQINLEPD